MAKNLQTISQIDFSGGMNTVVNPHLVSQRQVVEATNLWLDEHGALRVRDGYSLLSTSPLTTPLLHCGMLVKTSGQKFPYAIQQQDAGGSDVVSFSATGGASGSVVSSLSQSVTLSPGVTMLVVQVAFADGSKTVTSVTYDGLPLTKVVRVYRTGASGIEIWVLINPPTGSAKSLVATFGSTSSVRVQWRAYVNARSISGLMTTHGSGTTLALAVSSATNHLVIDGYVANSAGVSAAPGAGQTEEFDLSFVSVGSTSGSHKAGASLVSMSQTLSTSTQWVYVAMNLSPVAGNVLYHTETNPWTLVGTLDVHEPIPTTVQALDTTVILNGYLTPRTWNGATLGTISAQSGQTVPPGAKHGAFHLSALWLWNTSHATTTLDGPSSLRASDANNLNSWPNANQTFISRDDGQVGMGMVPFTVVETGISPTATLVLFKNYSTYQVTGVFGSSSFSVQPIKSDMGCIAPRTIQFVSGFGVIRLTHKGFALFNGVEDRLISEEIRPSLFGGVGITPLNMSTIERSWAVQCQNPPLYIAACPVEGTTLTRIFVYDLVRRGWTTMSLPVGLSTLALILNQTDLPEVRAGTASGGQLLKLFAQQDTDNGADVTWRLKTRRYSTQNPVQPMFWRRASVDVVGTPNKRVSVTLALDEGTRRTEQYLIPDNGTPTRLVATYDIMETAHDVQVTVEGSGPASIRGVELQASPKPQTRFLSRR